MHQEQPGLAHYAVLQRGAHAPTTVTVERRWNGAGACFARLAMRCEPEMPRSYLPTRTAPTEMRCTSRLCLAVLCSLGRSSLFQRCSSAECAPLSDAFLQCAIRRVLRRRAIHDRSLQLAEHLHAGRAAESGAIHILLGHPSQRALRVWHVRVSRQPSEIFTSSIWRAHDATTTRRL